MGFLRLNHISSVSDKIGSQFLTISNSNNATCIWQKLVMSMPRRLQMVIKKRGDMTKY
jgi:hypothetical protein